MTTPLLSGRLTPRVTVITGSSSGVGRACALAFAANGACPIICSDLRPEARGEWGLAEAQVPTHELICQRYGQGKAVFVQCDVTVAEQVAHLIQKAVEVGASWHRLMITILRSIINNAGTGGTENAGKIHEMGEDTWDLVMSAKSPHTLRFDPCIDVLPQEGQ
ncbi:MAG: hypothetical protein LQ342_007543 [Letrouitia transgressa]|nr:MAG: hypothetical protein LQ342_007543 [Letrouitia transgressa]